VNFSKTYYIPTAKALENWPSAPPTEGKSQELGPKSQEQGIEVPEQLQGQLNSLGKKAKADDVRKVILALLKWRELSVSEIAKYLNRTSEYVSRNYISDLVEADLIKLSNPENPTDPRQKYRASRMNKTDNPGGPTES